MAVSGKAELNYFYMHFKDADYAVRKAQETDHGLAGSYFSRQAILSTVFASEALINRVLHEFLPDKSLHDSAERLSIPEKWLWAPIICTRDHQAPITFSKSQEPFQSFSELVRIRNEMVHSHANSFLPAVKTDDTITVHTDSTEETTEHP